MAKDRARLHPQADQIQVGDDTWLELGDLREVVRLADEHGWGDKALVSHSLGREHPSLRHLQIATRLVVEGPS